MTERAVKYKDKQNPIQIQKSIYLWCRFLSFSMAPSICSMPPFFLIASVEKLQWAPAPFQSPAMGLGSNVTTTPKSSATRSRIYLRIRRCYDYHLNQINTCNTWPSRGRHPWRFPRKARPGTPTGRASPRRWCRSR